MSIQNIRQTSTTWLVLQQKTESSCTTAVEDSSDEILSCPVNDNNTCCCLLEDTNAARAVTSEDQQAGIQITTPRIMGNIFDNATVYPWEEPEGGGVRHMCSTTTREARKELNSKIKELVQKYANDRDFLWRLPITSTELGVSTTPQQQATPPATCLAGDTPCSCKTALDTPSPASAQHDYERYLKLREMWHNFIPTECSTDMLYQPIQRRMAHTTAVRRTPLRTQQSPENVQCSAVNLANSPFKPGDLSISQHSTTSSKQQQSTNQTTTMATTPKFVVPELPYAKDALEPAIPREIVEFHYEKHHKGYATKLNQLVAGKPEESKTLVELVQTSAPGPIFNNAAQVYNHTFYWEGMKPGSKPSQAVIDVINKNFGSIEELKKKFCERGVAHFGSGWVWLVQTKEGKLELFDGHDAGCPLAAGLKPILTVDVWEHAYYLKYKNLRADYLPAWFDIVNWEFVAKNLGL